MVSVPINYFILVLSDLFAIWSIIIFIYDFIKQNIKLMLITFFFSVLSQQSWTTVTEVRDNIGKHCGFGTQINNSYLLTFTYSNYIKHFDVGDIFKNTPRGIESICIQKCPDSYFSLEEHQLNKTLNCSDYESSLICKEPNDKCLSNDIGNKCILTYYASTEIYKRCVPKIGNLTIGQVLHIAITEYEFVKTLMTFGSNFIKDSKSVSISFLR